MYCLLSLLVTPLLLLPSSQVNEPPVCILRQSYLLGRGSATGTVIGALSCSDEDNSVAHPEWGRLTYSLASGNVNDTFELDPVLGTLEVSTVTQYTWIVNHTFALNASVADGAGLKVDVVITVLVTDSNHNPVVCPPPPISLTRVSLPLLTNSCLIPARRFKTHRSFCLKTQSLVLW